MALALLVSALIRDGPVSHSGNGHIKFQKDLSLFTEKRMMGPIASYN